MGNVVHLLQHGFPPGVWLMAMPQVGFVSLCVLRSGLGVPEHLPLPEGVDDAPVVLRRRLVRKTPVRS